MRKQQIDGIKHACRKIHSLCYTRKYVVSVMNFTPLDCGDFKIDFEIKRDETPAISKETIYTYQTGTIYVSKNGALYWYNFTHKKKPVTIIGYVVSGFYRRDIDK